MTIEEIVSGTRRGVGVAHGAGPLQEPERPGNRQTDHVVEAAALQRSDEGVGVLLNRVAPRLVPPLARGHVGGSLGREDGSHRDPGRLHLADQVVNTKKVLICFFQFS